jgi:eukaryotic-like serine/threonine-protein kinase
MANVRYQALGPLLSGEGSRAFLGLEVIDDTRAGPVVLVWVPEDVTLDGERSGQIARETARAALLEHPNIIRVFGLASLDEGIARVVEFADGEGLRRILDVVKHFPPRLAARIAVDAAMGVHYAHIAGNDDGTPLVHGDVRPETLLISHQGVTKVSGFGALSVAPRETGGSRVRGRRAHCAPEQVLGGRETMSRATDVYLLGLVLYECIVGAVPFEGQADYDQAVLSEPIPALPAEAEAPAALNEVLRRAMGKRATDRYPTAQSFRDAVMDALPDIGTAEELGEFLAEHFPEMEEHRISRYQVIQKGIAEYAPEATRASRPGSMVPPAQAGIPPPRASGSRKAIVVPPPTAPSPASVEAPPASAPSPKPQRTARRALTAPELSATDAPKRSHARLFALGLGVLLVVLVIAQLASSGKKRPTKAETPGTETAAAAESDSGPAVAAIDPAPIVAPVPALAPAAAIPTPPEPAKPPEPPSLVLTSTPPLDVTVDGRSLGKTPLTAPLPGGSYVLKLADRALGINITRNVRVLPRGKTTQNVNVGKGAVQISAPDGAIIYIDGQKKGVAPVKDIEVYEGEHRISVSMGKAKWGQPFKVRPGERMYFNVEEQ